MGAGWGMVAAARRVKGRPGVMTRVMGERAGRGDKAFGWPRPGLCMLWPRAVLRARERPGHTHTGTADRNTRAAAPIGAGDRGGLYTRRAVRES